MSSDLFGYLMNDREAELPAQIRQQEAHVQRELQQILEETVMVRFATAPIMLVRDIRRVQQPTELHRLIVAVQQTPDLAGAEQLLREAGQ